MKFELWRRRNRSKSSQPAISIPERSLATKLKSSQHVSVICCESQALWRKHLKRSAGESCLLSLFAEVNLLTLLFWWTRLCLRACARVPKKHMHTPTGRQMETHAPTEESVIHPCRACAHKAASTTGAGGCRGGRLESLWLTNVPSYFQAPVSRWLINLRTSPELLIETAAKEWERKKHVKEREIYRISACGHIWWDFMLYKLSRPAHNKCSSVHVCWLETHLK